MKRLAAAALGAWLLLGCRNIERFDTEPGAAYCGEMVKFDHNGFVSGEPRLEMQLELDIDSLAAQPGVITTFDRKNDPTSWLCRPRALFEQAPLRAIPEVMTDQLSLLEFGDGREYNFFAWADSTCLGTVVAVVSLMKNDQVEVRLLKPKPAPPPGAPEAELPGFILFRLNRDQSPCPATPN